MLIYCAINTVNNKRYIGQTQKSLSRRKKQHLSDSKRLNTKFYRAIRKYGWDSFQFTVIETAVSVEELNTKEEFWIRVFNSVEKGYNTTYGGLNYTMSKPHKDKISKSKKGIKFTPKHIENMSKAKLGIKKPELKQKRVEEGWQAKEKHPLWGKKHSDSSKLKMGKNHTFRRPIRCDQTGQEFESVAEASKALKLHKASICSVLNGKRNSIYGLTFSPIKTKEV